ncbi:hypothetical protein OAF54_01665 [bacterium]|nr:hypothetical protein [bacterium]
MRKGKRLDEIGGEVVTVTVTVNGKFLASRSASMFEKNKYRLDNGGNIDHIRAKGPLELAVRMLKRL